LLIEIRRISASIDRIKASKSVEIKAVLPALHADNNLIAVNVLVPHPIVYNGFGDATKSEAAPHSTRFKIVSYRSQHGEKRTRVSDLSRRYFS